MTETALESTAVTKAGYAALVRRVRETVEALVPADAVVSVVSKGDGELIRFEGRKGCHFPQNESGVWAGYHPADGADAVSMLHDAMRRGSTFFVVPATSYWWFEHYPAFREHLEGAHELIVDDAETCALYRLRAARPSRRRGAEAAAHGSPVEAKLAALVQALLPDGALLAVLDDTNAPPRALGRRTIQVSPAAADAAGAAAALEETLASGADYLVVPAWSLPLLDSAAEARLRERARRVTAQRHVGHIYELGGSSSDG